MKAVLLTGHGGLEKLEVRHDVPIPQPTRGEVLIKVGAAGVNNTDIWTREGAYQRGDGLDEASGWQDEPMVFPRIQGLDAAGRIVAVGEGVSEDRISERVLVDPVLYSDIGDGIVGCDIIGSERDGAFADYMVVPADNAVQIRSDLTDAELASFPTSYVTGERMLVRARVTAGERILITGASGGVGSGVVQLAKIRGCQVVAMVSGGKENLVRQLGADFVVLRDVDPLKEALKAATGNNHVDVVADVVGGPGFGQLLDILRPEGRYVTVGAIAGPIVELDLRTLYLNHLELIGSTMGSRKEFQAIVRYIEDGKLKPLVAHTYPLTEIKQAQIDFKAKGFFGKLVLIP